MRKTVALLIVAGICIVPLFAQQKSSTVHDSMRIGQLTQRCNSICQPKCDPDFTKLGTPSDILVFFNSNDKNWRELFAEKSWKRNVIPNLSCKSDSNIYKMRCLKPENTPYMPTYKPMLKYSLLIKSL
ncbi:MAG: hypothetical protein Q8928_11380 [Bacteroidota bacterium]|nr:hypothetical protein [Bacteroidota bacterium]